MRRIKFNIVALGVLLLTALPAQAAVYKIATLAPDGTQWMTLMRQASSEIAKQTNNRVKLKFYPGGIMGNEDSVMRKMKIGQLHGAALTSSALKRIDTDNYIYSLPLTYRSYEEMNHIRSKLDQQMIDRLKNKGYIAFKIAGDGFSYMLSREKISGVEDLKQQKVWIPPNDIMAQTMLETAGVSPVSLPLTDVLTGLQTGLISTVGAPPSFAIALQWHTKVKYLVDVPMFFSFGAFVFSDKSFKKMSGADQAVVRKEISETFDKLSKINWENNKKAKAALKQQGIEFVKPNTKEMAGLNKLAKDVVAKLIKQGKLKQSEVNQVYKMLNAARKK
ncbi:MAG: TRAP transporter substrate-binding protein DctP [Gammaproteobacteria bacterium]|nr:TRAP transporter substrate-binding protein DctP [Gammaproteobacteria bacterium]